MDIIIFSPSLPYPLLAPRDELRPGGHAQRLGQELLTMRI